MSLAEIVAGVLVIGLVLFDVFQAVIVPRPSTSGIGLARYIVAVSWRVWRRYGESLAASNKRERRLGAYAPFILVLLLFFWGATLIVGFGLVMGELRDQAVPQPADFWSSLYFAGTSFITIGPGEFTPATTGAR